MQVKYAMRGILAIESVALLYGFVSSIVVQLTDQFSLAYTARWGAFIFLGLMVAMAALTGWQAVCLGRARGGRTVIFLQTLLVIGTLYFLAVHPNLWPEMTLAVFAIAGLVAAMIWDRQLRSRLTAS
jgi:hypothetical protein